MRLSRLALNPRSRVVARCVGDIYRLHQQVMVGFGEVTETEAARAALGVLHRLEMDPRRGRIMLYVQSRDAPDWSILPSGFLVEGSETEPNPAVRSLAPMIEQVRRDLVMTFRLRGNATEKNFVTTADKPGKVNGQRFPVQDRRAWLIRKGEQHGFALEERDMDVRVTPEAAVSGMRPETGSLTLEGALYEGLLKVVEVERFRAALAGGIGPGKAFGFGLLSVAMN